MKDLAGKTAFVTGAASGIGLGIAAALAQAGVKVMLCDIEGPALARAVEGLKLTNADVDGVKADISLKPELKAAAEATVARYGKVWPVVLIAFTDQFADIGRINPTGDAFAEHLGHFRGFKFGQPLVAVPAGSRNCRS